MWRALLIVTLGCGRIGYEARPVDAITVDTGEDGAPRDAMIDATSDASAPAGCGAIVHFVDTFDDGVAAPTFAVGADTGLTVVEENGQLGVQFAGTVAGGNYAYYRTPTAYPVDGLCVVVEPVEHPQNGGAIFVKLRTAQLEVEMFGYDDVIELRTRQSNTPTVRGTLVLDLAVHRFWRLRQQGTTTIWETSQDGIGFVVQAMVTGVFLANTCQLELGAGAIDAVTAGGAARFESAALYAD